MNTSADCLTPDQVNAMLEGDLSPADAASVESHLSDCEECRARLDHASGDHAWWGEARESLLATAGAQQGGAEAAYDDVLRLLGPTDDPRMLGRIGTYEIAGILGRGGMGVVFKGFDAALNRYVAIKMLLPHLAATGAARRRFAREAQAAAAVVDDHVMPIHNVAEWQGMPYLVMPYSRGVSLQRRLTEQGPLELREILRIGMQTARALSAAHAQGLVHRDVKPGNIMLAEGVERVTLTDFGLARAADDATLTRTGALAGTPQYMSPEQVRGEADDARSDLFSLGSVLYAACTGRAPFRAQSSYGVLRMITDVQPQPIREINADVPAWLAGIIEKLMAKRSDDRFASAREVAELLEGCLAHVQQPTRAALPAAAKALAKTRGVRAKSQISNFKSRISRRMLIMVTTLFAIVFGIAGYQNTAPPDIAGQWNGDEWGSVLLKQTAQGEYVGTYTDTFGKTPGEIHLTWSRMAGRFEGTWREGADRFGEISVRLVDKEIRGALTTDKASKINPGSPKLADLSWKRERAIVAAPQAAEGVKTSVAPALLYQYQIKESVRSIACSPNGKSIAVSNDNATFPIKAGATPAVQILDGQTGKVLVSPELTTGDEDAILAAIEGAGKIEVGPMAFSPDGTFLAIATGLGQVKIFIAQTGELVQTLDDDKGKRAEKTTPELLKTLKRAMGVVNSMAFSPDGTLLAMSGTSFGDVARNWGNIERMGLLTSGSGRVKIFETKTGALKADFNGFSHAEMVAFSPDGKLLACAGRWTDRGSAGGVKVFEVDSGKPLTIINKEANGGSRAVVFSPDSKLVAFGSQIFDKDSNGSTTDITVAHANTGIMEWSQHLKNYSMPLTFSPDGKNILSLSGNVIRMIDVNSGTMKGEVTIDKSGELLRWNCSDVSLKAHLLVMGGISKKTKGIVEVWDLAAEARAGDPDAGAASPAKSDAAKELFKVKLDAARNELDIAEKRFRSGLTTASEYQAARDKLDILETELIGDPVKTAQARVSAARKQLELAESYYKNGVMTALDYEKAKSKLSIAEAELRAAEEAAKSSPANPASGGN